MNRPRADGLMLSGRLVIRTIRRIFLVIRLKLLFIGLRKSLVGDFWEISVL